MTTFPVRYEPGYVHDWLKSSPDRQFGTEAGTIKAGEGVLDHGTVLAKETASGKYVAYRPGGNDGSEKACALLYYPVNAGANDVGVAVITRRVLINPDGLKWHPTCDAAAKVAALAAFAPLEILPRVEL